MWKTWTAVLVVGMAVILMSGSSLGDEQGNNAKANDGDNAEQSAEIVLEEMLKRRSENPLIKADASTEEQGGVVVMEGDDVLAGGKKKLLREGSFVVSRRGRLSRTGGGTNWLFVFESDNGVTDPPMYLLPCRKLEVMEKIYGEYGDAAVFVMTGQVFVYHGANYLMPTVMTQAPNRGNIE